MSTFPFDIVLFDLDGTLVDSNLDLAPAVNHALAAEGRDPVSHIEVRGFIGGGAARMLGKALEASGGPVSETRYEELTTIALDHYWAHIADNTVPFPGCIAALEALQARGVAMAVCTNKSEGPARQLIEALGMTHFFTAIYGADTLGRERAKPDPAMLLAAAADCGGGRFAMIGDSTFDTLAAKAAGAPVVVLSFGYNDIAPAAMDADAVIDDFAELIPALEII